METKREVDPLLSLEASAPGSPTTRRARCRLGLISPIFADLSGLPPLIIQAGSHEVLLDDAIRLAGVAAIADVEVTLDITPGVPHVFQASHPILDEAVAALDRAGQFLSAHLAGSPSGGPNSMSEIQGVSRFKFGRGKSRSSTPVCASHGDRAGQRHRERCSSRSISTTTNPRVLPERYRDSEAVVDTPRTSATSCRRARNDGIGFQRTPG